MIKGFKNFMKESLSFKKKTTMDTTKIIGYINDQYIGEVIIEYITSGYYEFEDVMSEERYDELFPDDKFAKIVHLIIDKEFTGNGYAKKLMVKALDEIKSKGEKTVYLNASPMAHKKMDINTLTDFYSKFGFKTIVDDYDENKEMILTIENASPFAGPNQTLKTINSFIKMYIDEMKNKKEKEKEETEDITPDDILINTYDESTPRVSPNNVLNAPTRKHNSLGDGFTNMP